MIKYRREYLFLYDVTDANPNGDPIDENRPRIDEEVGVCIVTDTRLKRTIRDELAEILGKEHIFLRVEPIDEEGRAKKSKERLYEEYGSKEEILNKCIDVRLFGLTLAIEKGKDKESRTITLTGPVQFKFGRSLHKVSVKLIKGTTPIPANKKDEKEGSEFTDFYVIPYGLFAFYGIANEKASEETKLTDEDLEKMVKAMWFGVKESTDVISRSKFGHMPRLLIEITYREGERSHIGELNKLVKITDSEVDELAIRDISQFKVDLSALKEAVEKYKSRIEKVRYAVDDRVRFKEGSEPEEVFKNVPLEKFPWA